MAQDFTNGYLQYADAAAYDFTTDLTIVARVNADSYGGGSGGTNEIVRKAGNYILRFQGTDIDFVWWDSSSAAAYRCAAPATGSYNSIAAAVSGNVPVDTYVNGVAQSAALAFSFGASQDLTDVLYIGGDSAGEYQDGKIAEVALYAAVLTADELKALNVFSPLLVRPSALRAYWPLIRGTNERLSGATATTSGTVDPIDHPRVYYPQKAAAVAMATAAVTTTPHFFMTMGVGG